MIYNIKFGDLVIGGYWMCGPCNGYGHVPGYAESSTSSFGHEYGYVSCSCCGGSGHGSARISLRDYKHYRQEGLFTKSILRTIFITGMKTENALNHIQYGLRYKILRWVTRRIEGGILTILRWGFHPMAQVRHIRRNTLGAFVEHRQWIKSYYDAYEKARVEGNVHQVEWNLDVVFHNTRIASYTTVGTKAAIWIERFITHRSVFSDMPRTFPERFKKKDGYLKQALRKIKQVSSLKLA